MLIYTLLHNIKDNKPVNFDQVVKYLPASVRWSNVFKVTAHSKTKHTVEVIDHALFDMLLEQSKPPVTRAQAASANLFSSHDVKCQSAYMLCFPSQGNLGQQINNDGTEKKNSIDRTLNAVAVSQKILLPITFTPAKHAILIENQDCFFQYQCLLNHYRSQISIAQCDIYFAGGLRILNTDLHCVLNQYERISCLFDYDLAGLQMALILRDKLLRSTDTNSPSNVEYLVADNIEKYASLFTFSPSSTKNMADMLDLCRLQNKHGLAEVINRRKCFMEQEALLTLPAEI